MLWNEAVSKVLGYFSIGCWLIVFAPQIYENYQRKSGEGISLLFLYIWILGDLFGLIGAVQQDLIVTALILYIYYFVADAILLAQIHYYSYVNKRAGRLDDNGEARALLADSEEYRQHHCHCPCHRHHHLQQQQQQPQQSGSNQDCIGCNCTGIEPDPSLQPEENRGRDNTTRLLSVFIPLIGLGLIGGGLSVGRNQSNYNALLARLGPVATLATKPEKARLFPQIMGYVSALLFLGARIPQIVKNYRKKSCEGLSIGMFIFSILGNVSFTLSLLLYSLDNNYILANIPWIIGSTGTLFFDLGIFYQFYLYHGTEDEYESDCQSDIVQESARA